MKKLTTILTLCIAQSYALDIQTTISTLGVGLKLSQYTSQKWSIVENINYLKIHDLVVNDNTFYGDYYGIKGELNTKNSLNINYLGGGVGMQYDIVQDQDITLSVEFGLNYNIMSYQNNSNLSASALDYVFTLQSKDSNRLEVNKLSPYSQLNLKAYITKKLFIGGGFGVMQTNLKIINTVNNNTILKIDYMPIVGVGIGYTF